MRKRKSVSAFMRLYEITKRPHRHDINTPGSRHMLNVRIIKQHLSNIWTSIHEKVKQRWGWLEKKRLGYKKACISLVPIMKTYLNYFLFRRGFEVIFAWIAWIGFPRPHFVDSEIVIWGLTLTDCYKRVNLFFKKRHVPDCQKKTSFVQITHLKFITFLTPYDMKSC